MTTQTTRARNPKVATGALALAALLIAGFEGTRTHAYLDSVGISTICVGHIHNVHMGDVATPEQCQQYLQGDLGAAYASVKHGLTHPQPDTRVAALTSLTFNIGTSAFLHSRVLRDINAGYIVQGCNDMLAWDHAGGRMIPGLLRRRQAERDLCLRS